jgi:hypothetical protein
MSEDEKPKPEEQDDGPIIFDWASKTQKAAVEASPGSPLLLMGGMNSGKTAGAILHMLALMEAFPGYKVAVLRKTFKDLSMTTRPSIDQWIDQKRVKNQSETEIVLDNGSSFIFHYLDNPNSATILKGLEINAAILDQAEQMQERTFNVLHGRLGRWRSAQVPTWVIQSRGGDWPWRERGTNRPIPPVSIVLTANPTEEGDPELHWLWQRFSPESKAFRDKWSKLGYRQLVFDSRQNRFAGQQNIDILLQGDEDYIKRFVQGEWVRSKGHLFHLSPDSIVPYSAELIAKIENTMVLGRAFDHGDSAPTCCMWFGVDQFHNIFFFQEYYQAGQTEDGKEFGVPEHRRSIKKLSEGITFRMNLADPSIFDKTRNVTGFARKQQRWSVADEYMDKKIIQEDTTISWTPADNNEALSRTRLKQYLKVDPDHFNPITKEKGAPHIYFVQMSDEWPHGCNHAISEIRNAKRKQEGENDGKPIYGDEREPNIPDHALDPVRYVVNSHPIAATVPAERRTLSAEVHDQGNRVIITVPPVDQKPIRMRRHESAQWRSKGGGY